MALTQHMKPSEKGLLTPDNCVVAFIDHQPQKTQAGKHEVSQRRHLQRLHRVCAAQPPTVRQHTGDAMNLPNAFTASR
jgi:hypothetical protein